MQTSECMEDANAWRTSAAHSGAAAGAERGQNRTVAPAIFYMPPRYATDSDTLVSNDCCTRAFETKRGTALHAAQHFRNPAQLKKKLRDKKKQRKSLSLVKPWLPAPPQETPPSLDRLSDVTTSKKIYSTAYVLS